MYKTIPVLRDIEMGERDIKVTFRTYQGYHLEEVLIRPSAIEGLHTVHASVTSTRHCCFASSTRRLR